MSIGTRRTPERNSPLFSGQVIQKCEPLLIQLTTGGGARTLTPAEVLGGIMPIDCDDAQTMTLPTAALLAAAIPGIEVGSRINFEVLNYGDTTCTVAVGTGITNKSISGCTSVLTIALQCSKRFSLVCTTAPTDVVSGAGAAFDLYGFGSVAASNA